MKVLIVARCKNGHYAPFITEQVSALEKAGVECRFFPMEEHGVTGYLRRLPALRREIRIFVPDIVHAHYGLCGLFANLQRHIPVVTTYHGSDINDKLVRKFSRCAIRLSAFNIFVSQKNIDLAMPRRNFILIPCGIDLEDYPLMGKEDARRKMGLGSDKKYVLFAGAFDNPVKNYPLARSAMDLVPEVELLELKGYSRPQVATLMQAVDALLMTSFTEGSPQVIKEAMACGCPIVSVDVGDVKERIEGMNGCYIAERNNQSIAEKIRSSFTFQGRTKGREVLEATGLTNKQIASEIMKVYHKLAK